MPVTRTREMPAIKGRLLLREKNNDRLLYQISRQAVTPADQGRKTLEQTSVFDGHGIETEGLEPPTFGL